MLILYRTASSGLVAQAHNPANSPTWQDYCDAYSEWNFAQMPQYPPMVPMGAPLPPLQQSMQQPLPQPHVLLMQNLQLQPHPQPQPINLQQQQQMAPPPLHPLRSYMGPHQQAALEQMRRQQQLLQPDSLPVAAGPGSPAEDISSMYTYLGNECDTRHLCPIESSLTF